VGILGEPEPFREQDRAPGYGRRGSLVMNIIKRLIQGDEGATAVEYAILVALIAVVILLGLRTLGTTLGTVIGSVDTSISSTTGSSGSESPDEDDD